MVGNRTTHLTASAAAWLAAVACAGLAVAAPSPPRATPPARLAVVTVDPVACWVGFELNDAAELGELTIAVDHWQAFGQFARSAELESICGDPTGAQATSAIDAVDHEGVLTVRLGSADGGVVGPAHRFACSFTSDDLGVLPTAADFDVHVLAAYDRGQRPITPPPSVSVAGVRCENTATTTTLGLTSTTTLPADAAKTTESEICLLTVAMSEAEAIAVLGFEIDYASAAGSFSGVGPFSECQNLSAADSAVFFDSEIDRTMIVTLSVMRGAGALSGSSEVARCAFRASEGAGRPAAADFFVHATLALAPGGQTAALRPRLAVSQFTCEDPAATVTTTTLPGEAGADLLPDRGVDPADPAR